MYELNWNLVGAMNAIIFYHEDGFYINSLSCQKYVLVMKYLIAMRKTNNFGVNNFIWEIYYFGHKSYYLSGVMK